MLIGGSYIGCEVAASLTAAHGVKCAIVMQEDVTLERQFGAKVGRFFQDVLEEHGVEVHGGDELERFEGYGRPRGQGRDQGRARARLRHGRDRRRA